MKHYRSNRFLKQKKLCFYTASCTVLKDKCLPISKTSSPLIHTPSLFHYILLNKKCIQCQSICKSTKLEVTMEETTCLSFCQFIIYWKITTFIIGYKTIIKPHTTRNQQPHEKDLQTTKMFYYLLARLT